MLVYELGALVELVLVILESSRCVRTGVLPLGGGQIQQIGLIFATAYVIAKTVELFKGWT
jgi:hypothetical protein